MASSLTGISIASSYDSLLKVGDNDGLSASLKVISDGLGTETGISLNNAGDLTATGTITANSFVGDLSGNISGNSTVSGTLTFGSLSDGVLTMTDILDEDNMSSNSSTALATQQSIKAYVDAQVTASDLDFQGDAGGQQSIDLDSEVLSIVGTTNEIQTNSTGNALTISLNPNISGLTSVAATTFTGALTGNADTATTLETSRNIAGVAFNGSSDISLTTDNITEGSNLYYTQARFDSALSAKSTTDLSEGTNLYFTDARADARVNLQTGANLDLSSKSTTDLSEGTNLYFTDERVDDRVANLVVASTGISATYDDVANSLTIANTAPDQTVALTSSNGLTSGGTYPNLTIAGDDATTSTKGVASFSSDHFSVSSGAVSLAADSIDDTLIDFGTGAGQVNTDDLPEGSTNVYWTAERTDDQVASLIVGGSGISAVYDDAAGTLTLNNTQSGIGLSDFSAIDAGGDGSFSYNNTTGAFTYTGPSTSEVQAHITKAYVDGLGIAALTATTLETARTINGVSFNGSANISFDTDSVSEGSSNLYYTTARFDTAFSGKSTTDLTEGTNLYYTDARVQAVSINALSEDTSPQLSANLDAQSYDITTTGKLYYANVFSLIGDLPSASTYHGMFAHVHGTGKGYFAHAGNWITLLDESSSTTDNLTEGSTNLYYTSTRANSDFDTRLATKSTTDLAEGTNLYYTDARFDTRLSAKTSDDLTEGSTNLYNQTHTGDVTGSVALTIASDAVTYDKMQDLVTANRVLGGTAAGTIAEVQIATDMIAAGAVTAAKVDTDLRNVQYIGLDSTDYMEFTDNTQIDLYINGSNEFRFEADGDFHADGDVIAYSTTTPSDERLKENVKVIENPLEKLDQLRGVTFDWIDREDKRSGGIIAQELEKVMPELVREVDSLKNEDSFKAVDYNGLIGLLIEAVKELNDKCNNCKK
tara:strand:+ start:958 stop:3765 length:2808 start_codon:yes stop_codon:yes gene_type:complete